MSQFGHGSSSSPCLNLVREVRQSVISSLSVVAVAAVCAVLVHLNLDTPQQAVTIAVAISATSTAFAVTTGLQTLKAIAAVALGVMIAVALTHPTGIAGAWVIGTVLFFVFAVLQPQRLRGRQAQG